MTFQSLRCNMISFRVFEAQHQKTMWTVAYYISWLGQTILAYFPLTSSLPDTPSHLWVAWGSGDLINSAPSLWSSFHLEIQNKEWVTGQLGWIRAPSSGDPSVSQAAHPGWVSSPGLWLHSLSRLSPVPRPPCPIPLPSHHVVLANLHSWVLGLKLCSTMPRCHLTHNMLYLWHLNPLNPVTP